MGTKFIIVSSKSNLKTLCPYLDENELIRVGGRLANSSLCLDAKHPLVLPAAHPFSKLIVEHEHVRNLHCGPQSLLYHTRQRFWIIGGRSLCSYIWCSIVHQCVRCFKAKPNTMQQIMGQLPTNRVNPARSFSIVGIEFCGPFFVSYKIRSKVKNKVYVCVFICFVSKAVHFEIVNDLTSTAFIAALRRFEYDVGYVIRYILIMLLISAELDQN